ncbi:MAG TPA: orotate phosphoribosyltransferase [Aquifex aeolicus]|uniref:Orotate phosphoribosyltransferase n=1 Tax=Aquifex aeolicus TaxID=63363 RepID=A0A9D0YNH0_AQUAO|nr:orotate phosphoribosyltransferase [Aquificales bacterium]HIP97756.1 orotate phosphoribosyltransferase [Aquifex aeolicus]HIQ25771.1 orotate phosphoribosyltransferase [Aquifex aeolicus]
MEVKERLYRLIKEKSLKIADKPIFKLSSGRLSRYYLDLKRVTLDPEGGYLIGHLLLEMVKPLKITAIGGLTLGADPIAYAVSLISYQKGEPIKPFIVRKEPKGHGTKRWIEGNVQPGEKVVVVEDVVTTAASALKAVKVCRDYGLEVVAVCTIVDRNEGGREKVEKEGLKLHSLFTIADFLNRRD